MDKDEYLEAWTEGDEKKVDPITDSVKAARKADSEAFADAFENDKFGIDVEAVAAKEAEDKPAEDKAKA